MKLKTLKDCGVDVGTHLVLKTEAIKWIKFLQTLKSEDICLICKKAFYDHNDQENMKGCAKNYPSNFLTNYDYESTDYRGAIKILKFLFNIKGGDLNDKSKKD